MPPICLWLFLVGERRGSHGLVYAAKYRKNTGATDGNTPGSLQYSGPEGGLLHEVSAIFKELDMIEVVEGDILGLQRGILVHGCNCHGVMGGGIAKLIRNKWPSVYLAYKYRYEDSGLFLGDTISVSQDSLGEVDSSDELRAATRKHIQSFTLELPSKLVVVNAMTQYDFGRDPEVVYVDYDALEAAFGRVRLLARDLKLPVHFPMIGCGLANGKWEEVSARIERALGPEVEKTLWVLPAVKEPAQPQDPQASLL